MNKLFKKISVLLLLLASVFLLVSCETETPNIENNPSFNDVEEELNIYYLNDTHGVVLEDSSKGQIGLSKIGNMVKDEFKNKPENTIFLTGGDMLQGQLISNKSFGAPMIEILNEMQLDAFTIGNHEFDWGIDIVLEYFNPNTTGIKANFPLLAANVFKKADNELLDYAQPYTIIERNNLKIGIIGVIGYGQESSIKDDRVEDYYFAEPEVIIKKYTKKLRNDENADIVIVVGHDTHDPKSSNFNSPISGLTGDEKVDAIFNAHTHRQESGFIDVTPYLQAGRNAEVLGMMNLQYHRQGEYIDVIYEDTKFHHYGNRSYDTRLEKSDTNIDVIINKYYKDVKDLYELPIIKASQAMSQSDVARFITRAMVAYTGADIALQNNGGTRAGFTNGQNVTAADLFQVFPFDNEIILYESKGSKITDFYPEFVYYKEVSTFNSNETYLVATNDYVFISNQDQAINGGELYMDLFEFLLMVMEDFRDTGLTEFNLNSEFFPKK